MILIADSGSTKTDWRLIDDRKKIIQFRTAGLNPFFLTSGEIKEIIQTEFSPEVHPEAVDRIFFYGAGCSSKEKCDVIKEALKSRFLNAEIEVYSDLLAACHSLFGTNEGIVAILGTGSNSCFYNGSEIARQVPSLGIILGDEGSGSHIGKRLLQGVFYRELPEQLLKKFDDRFHLSKEDVLEAVYRKKLPNQFLASFAHFAFQQRNEPSISKLIYTCFKEFFEHHISGYDAEGRYPIHCTGSIAYNFSEIFRQVAADKKIKVGTITESPISGLSLYYLGES
jgi:glucosamine kinase